MMVTCILKLKINNPVMEAKLLLLLKMGFVSFDVVVVVVHRAAHHF